MLGTMASVVIISFPLSLSVFAHGDVTEHYKSIDIAGAWESGCEKYKGSYIKLVFENTKKDWELNSSIFADKKCKNPLITVNIEGPYKIEGPSNAELGAFEGAFYFKNKSITVHNKSAVAFVNNKNCMKRNWTLNKAYSINHSGCLGLGQLPLKKCKADYDLVKIDGNGMLSFGVRPSDNNLCDVKRRPKKISPLKLRKV